MSTTLINGYRIPDKLIDEAANNETILDRFVISFDSRYLYIEDLENETLDQFNHA